MSLPIDESAIEAQHAAEHEYGERLMDRAQYWAEYWKDESVTPRAIAAAVRDIHLRPWNRRMLRDSGLRVYDAVRPYDVCDDIVTAALKAGGTSQEEIWAQLEKQRQLDKAGERFDNAQNYIDRSPKPGNPRTAH